MHVGSNNSTRVSSIDDDQNRTPDDEPNIHLSPVDCATLDILKLCHDAGVSLEFYGILFVLLCNHSTENKVEVTKLPKLTTS